MLDIKKIILRAIAAFNAPFSNTIQSDKGFSVEILSRTELAYHEGEKTAKIGIEILVPWSPAALIVFQSSMYSWSGENSHELIDQETRERILSNIKEAFKLRGKEIQII